MREIQELIETKLVNGKRNKSYFYTTAEEDAEYYKDLAETANIKTIPRVLTNIHSRAIKQMFQHFPLFRSDKYKVLDDENFTVDQSS